MILEMASLEIDPAQAAQFEAAVRAALPLFARARGCGGAQLHRVIEHSGGYLLVVEWETVDDHMVHFRQSDDFQAWRQLAGPFFKSPPQVVHTEVAVK
ncbi:antibiotic biosynthesis monooxygenase family protein [Burkholderia vietnamiensis]|uniref:antibiotic biosynthesis monooxygenase family protein n=1 Tax=Burkholderia vietnamiensis TaxID=60552 RepID=UPI000757F499|nr:antibiotic biosynthesis monooxygenase family protein [Burkholderia vietnamiensis]KVF82147.1 antibiotic biosynthesis monooxygenase [Burkholderia vietnamiensis]KVF83722.1 antibiotic biosynthesis monooxygenase [Burkholderia vietnamiensis]KVF91941.1 antibiotic biosynthesis monooxygenase [Burkholderia vietnamiensis]KVG00751.1 antibiotic biosynthesis monooxygenase [Burkholderia vietnamiensis]MBR7920686.1 antibiotic biosynthesis monooxygenase [Burkholderia vietnamiensis]